jgi:SPX domain protein involved in polyphosphate accumulation
MHRLASESDITLRSRFECKYLISPLVVPSLREFIHPFMRPDRYAALREGNRYPISSLYLDTEDLLLYMQTVGGDKNRFKLRIRTYSDEPSSPAYFEVKRKVNNIVQKRRAALNRERTEAILEEGLSGWLRDRSCDLLADIEHFTSHVSLAVAKPVIRIRYFREAYESRGGDPVRITIDTELMHVITLDSNLSHTEGRWTATPVDGTILEIKFTERYPAWVSDLVRTFGLKQQPVPKYVMSVDHVLMGGRESTLSLAGFTLSTRRA